MEAAINEMCSQPDLRYGIEIRHENDTGRAHGKFIAHGIRPTFMPRLEAAGVRLPSSAFRQRIMLED